MHVICRVTHVAGHSEETTVSMPFESKAGSSPQQKYGTAQTYGMRYSLIAALGITTADDDTDGNAPADEPEPVTDEELAALTDLLDEIGDRVKNETKLLAWLGVDALADITRADYARAIAALKAKPAAT